MQNIRFLTPEARHQFERLIQQLEPNLEPLTSYERKLFTLRFERHFQNLFDGLKPLYGRRGDFNDVLTRVDHTLAHAYTSRPDDLKTLDIERDLTPDWFQRETMIGYVFYVERFAHTLTGIEEHLDYLEELGVTYVHLMYCLKPREGENDGGYAIEDYRQVDPKLGTIDDLEHLCTRLRERGISACVDLVLNHCAKDHVWAKQALAGDSHYQDYFYMFPDRRMPDRFEESLPEVFPNFAPGNFSYYSDIDRWVWTTFYEFQWDLNWTNPNVFLEVIDILLYLANKGIEVMRLDAVAFMWKRLGTNSQNQPEVHDILQAIRSCSKIVAPAVAHKAEAIVSPDDLIHYFGTGKRYGKVSNIAYHNTLMVQFWSALASRNTTLMKHTMQSFPRTPSSIAWGTYIRCHDDIGWAITDDDAEAVNLDAFAHRHFLSDYYSGQFPGSHSKGELFQYNPITQDSRISGMFASLVGLEQATDNLDARGTALSIERMLLGFALMLGFGGIPLLYMGDEIALLNDYSYQNDPDTARDNRWMHRPYMDWAKANQRHQAGSVEYRVFQGLLRLIRARKHTPQLHSYYETITLQVEHPALLAMRRAHPLGVLLSIYNFTETHVNLDTQILDDNQLNQPFDQIEQRFIDISDGQIRLGPYARLWLI
ncbi:MAG: alpha-amylase family protein [Deinococcota bacterium]